MFDMFHGTYFTREDHLWRIQRVVHGKRQPRRKDAPLKARPLRAGYQRLPFKVVLVAHRARHDP